MQKHQFLHGFVKRTRPGEKHNFGAFSKTTIFTMLRACIFQKHQYLQYFRPLLLHSTVP